MVVWDKTNCLKEAESQMSDENSYGEIRITEKNQDELVEKK